MTKAVLASQAKWKTIGFGPKKENDQVWKEFRAVCDDFFNAKKEFYNEIQGQYDALALKKKDLITQANALKESTDWKDTANKLKQLQQKWKQIGHSGVKHEQKLWKEFRGACDAFFNSREAFFGAKDKENEVNLTAKKEVLAAIDAYTPNADKNTAIDDLKKFAAEICEKNVAICKCLQKIAETNTKKNAAIRKTGAGEIRRNSLESGAGISRNLQKKNTICKKSKKKLTN